ncbi:MAG: thermonuclease family protein [Chloracidobacterium sp.]|nr:thermonuclease family protein [Chloracidobacterium sp.]
MRPQLLILLICLLLSNACIPRTRVNNSAPAPTKEIPASPYPNEQPRQQPKDPDLPARTLVGRVVGVHDGDTITVLDENKVQHKIRLSGIDAPEICQDFGHKAKEKMAELVFGKQVTVLHDKVDRYGRLVGKVLVDGQDANLALIADGFAWHFKKYESEQTAEDRVLYADAEQKARQEKRGLWIQPNPMPPWEFRLIRKCSGKE